MPACEGCYKAKVRCELTASSQQDSVASSSGVARCSRCKRLDLECIPRISSRTGTQGGAKKRRQSEDLIPSRRQEHDGLVPGSADGTLVHHVASLGRHHFGVLYLIHSWVSFAFARRSFSLLSRASRLAASVGVSMDDIFNQRRKPILEPLLFHTLPEQQQVQDVSQTQQLQWSDLPTALRSVCSVKGAESMHQRYVWVREAKYGQSRFLVSQAFQRDIASLWVLEQTWRANDQAIIQVFTEGPADNQKFTQAICYQTARYAEPSTPPEPLRVHGMRVKLKNRRIQEMDLVYAFEIVTLEHSFYLAEFVVPPQGNNTLATGNAAPNSIGREQQINQEAVAVNSSKDNFDDLDDLEIDDDLQQILDLIKGD